MEPPRLQRIIYGTGKYWYDSRVFNTKPKVIETGPLDATLLKRKRQNQKKDSLPLKIKVTVEHINPAKIMGERPGITRRGGKKRHRTKKRRRKRRKHFKGGLFERPGIGIKAGLFPVRIKTENSTDDTKTWDPCWKVSTRAHRGWIVDKGMESRVVPTKEIKPQGMRSKKDCYISGGKRKKTHRRKNINADVSVKLIKNNFIYVKYSVIFSDIQ